VSTKGKDCRLKIINVVGARPNFMKMAPIIEAMNRHPSEIEHLLVHTGQHYDEKMSKAFFNDLGMPKPDIDLEIGSGSHAEQTGRVMMEFEKVCLQEKPDLVIVVGDVNSTMACTITAKKLDIRVAHVEAGLRSGDMTMPEEINRLCTDVLCDYLFTTDRDANENLLAQGVAEEKIFFVGNVMIDTLLKHEAMAERLTLRGDLGLTPKGYATVTLHRPSNVDDPAILTGILEALSEIARELPVVFPDPPAHAQDGATVWARALFEYQWRGAGTVGHRAFGLSGISTPE
jgi:UDP-N-acetylglucosamine 2-epimerase (non-hydrolysing)